MRTRIRQLLWLAVTWLCASVALAGPGEDKGQGGPKQVKPGKVAHEGHRPRGEADDRREKLREKGKARAEAMKARVEGMKAKAKARAAARSDKDDASDETDEAAATEQPESTDDTAGDQGRGSERAARRAKVREAAARFAKDARSRAKRRLKLVREGREDELKAAHNADKVAREARRKAKWQELKAAMGADATHKRGPDMALANELRKHAKRVAQLARIAALAEADGKAEILARIEKLTERENERHAARVAALSAKGATAPEAEAQGAAPEGEAAPAEPGEDETEEGAAAEPTEEGEAP